MVSHDLHHCSAHRIAVRERSNANGGSCWWQLSSFPIAVRYSRYSGSFFRR